MIYTVYIILGQFKAPYITHKTIALRLLKLSIFQVEQKYIEKPLAVRTEIKEYWNVLRPIYDKYAVDDSSFKAANDVL